ncbi:hypothetical protein [Selenomonas sp. oral taxon 136]|uniref:hypothetical protein n=1 Tax=Selenomonas sp. oral taxon 136 TaxID=713030 RepID=UPI0007680958|nr:hypothetical protein [Selenomonas sp. oral taxon 136]AME03617.1 hypothetical protein AXE86_05770 [Selenomonas sp. oral taxon 136]
MMTSMIVLILFGVVACGAALWSMYCGLRGGATKKFLHFENGRLTVYYYSFPGMHEKTYALDQIREVRFTHHWVRSPVSHTGKMQIVLHDGTESRSFFYDGSVHMKKMVLATSLALMSLTTKELAEEFRRHGVRRIIIDPHLLE